MLLAQAGYLVQGSTGVGRSPPDILMEDIGQWVRLALVQPVMQKDPAFLPFREALVNLEAAGAMPAREDGPTVG